MDKNDLKDFGNCLPNVSTQSILSLVGAKLRNCLFATWTIWTASHRIGPYAPHRIGPYAHRIASHRIASHRFVIRLIFFVQTRTASDHMHRIASVCNPTDLFCTKEEQNRAICTASHRIGSYAPHRTLCTASHRIICTASQHIGSYAPHRIGLSSD